MRALLQIRHPYILQARNRPPMQASQAHVRLGLKQKFFFSSCVSYEIKLITMNFFTIPMKFPRSLISR
jgi:hypothetical protein